MPNIIPALQALAVPIASLHPDPANARKHNDKNLDAIKASLAKFGQRKPVVVQREGMIVRAGNGTLAAAKALGWTEVAAVVLDDDNATASQFAIADNRTAELAEWDNETLATLLDGMDEQDRELLGFDADDMKQLIGELTPEIVEDEVPEPPAEPITKPGDLWLLGEHRVLCGDSMDRDAIARLYGGDSVDFILTDPPYCSGGFQESKRTIGSTQATIGTAIARDNLTTEGLSNLIEASIGRLPCDGACYVFCDWRQIFAIRKAVEPLGYQYRALLIWDKGNTGMGGPWRHAYEMCYFGTKRKEPPTGKSGDIIRCNRSGNEHHTTEKPVQLISAIIDNTVGKSIADPFLGSGTTLIAAEQLGRKCYGMEISPAYCDVIVKRWETLTGKKAVLADG
jgi:DNA modification methylase